MANIRSKNIRDLSDWNEKELRKLKITTKNRLESFDMSSKPKELPENHPLKSFSKEDCNVLLQNIAHASKSLRTKD